MINGEVCDRTCLMDGMPCLVRVLMLVIGRNPWDYDFECINWTKSVLP